MRELVKDPFYQLIRQYPRCIIDYCLIEDDTPYQGYRSHKDAVLFAMLKIIERYIDEQLKEELRDPQGVREEPFPWSLDLARAHAHPIGQEQLLHVPKILGHGHAGNRIYDCSLPDPLNGEQIPYWYAFWEPPHPSGYGPEEFRRVNSVLFPKGTEDLEIYEWTTDWSNYFEDGREWWGTACWSVYDPQMNRIAVIMAECTD